MPVKEILDCPLYVMRRWGHVACFRFDNGRPFGDPKRETVSPLALHLVARGCDVMFNPPRTPTGNAKVERCQGTTGRWADAASCPDIETFRENLEYAVVAQRERLKTRVCNKLTRMEAYPGLMTNPRKYDGRDFDPRRVYRLLSKGLWYRKVSKMGQVSLFGQRFQLGLSHRGKEVSLKLTVNEGKLMWNCFDEGQSLIKQLEAGALTDSSYFSFNIPNLSKN